MLKAVERFDEVEVQVLEVGLGVGKAVEFGEVVEAFVEGVMGQ